MSSVEGALGAHGPPGATGLDSSGGSSLEHAMGNRKPPVQRRPRERSQSAVVRVVVYSPRQPVISRCPVSRARCTAA